MDENERWEYLQRLDEELLLGGALFSEWAIFLSQEADTAFAKGADLASIFTAVAAIETYLRIENGGGARDRLVDLIDAASLEADLKTELHRLRRYRNRWVHVGDEDDQPLIDEPEKVSAELAVEARRAARALRRVLYSNQLV